MAATNSPTYVNLEALKPVEKLISEASAALQDPNRITSDDKSIKEALGAAAGIGVGGTIGFSALFYGGSAVGLSAAGITSGLAAAGKIVGGGMAAGIGVLAAPAIVLGVGGYALVSRRNKKRLIERKELLLQEVQRKQNAIIKELSQNIQQDKERIEYLTGLNTLLQAAMKELRRDLAGTA